MFLGSCLNRRSTRRRVLLNKEQGTTTRPFVVCRWRGSRHELRRARGVQCRREDGDAGRGFPPSCTTGRARESALKVRQNWSRRFRRERGFAMGWKCAWIRRGLVVRRTPSSPALRYHGLQRAVAPPRGGGERRKGWVGSSWLRSEKEFFSSSSAM